MKITMTCRMFVTEMLDIRFDEISPEGLEVLFQHLEDGDPSDTEFDPIAIFSEFSEYEDQEELEETYSMPLAAIEEHTVVLKSTTETYIIQDF